MDDYMIGRNEVSTVPKDLDRLRKVTLIDIIRTLEAKIEQNKRLPDLMYAKTGEMWEEIHSRLFRQKMLEGTGE